LKAHFDLELTGIRNKAQMRGHTGGSWGYRLQFGVAGCRAHGRRAKSRLRKAYVAAGLRKFYGRGAKVKRRRPRRFR
jgi:hypothetical protein